MELLSDVSVRIFRNKNVVFPPVVCPAPDKFLYLHWQ
jgi:hypothetical protein